MATKPYTAFLPEVLPSAPGVPELVAINAIRNAAIELCSTSFIWAETQDSVSVSDADFPYDITPPSGAVVDTVLVVKINGKTLSPKSVDSLDALGDDWESGVGTPTMYYQPSPEQLRVVPLPDSTVQMSVRAAYTPSRSSTSIEGFIYERYLESIAAGALWRLLATPGQTYSNMDLAMYYKTMFDVGVRKAVRDAQKSFTTASARVRDGGFV